MSLIVSFDFKDISSKAVLNMLDKQCMGIHLNISGQDPDDKSFGYESLKEEIDSNDNVKFAAYTYFKKCQVSDNYSVLAGMFFENFNDLRIKIIEEDNSNELNDVFISKSFANFHSLSMNDELTITIDSTDYIFHIKGIVQDSLFISQNSNPIIVNIDYLNSILGVSNRATSVFVGAKSLDAVDSLYNDLMNKLSLYNVQINKNYNPDSYTFYLEPISTSILIFSIFSIFISAFLCFYIFKSLVVSNQRRIAIQRSIGVTSRDLYLSTLVECITISLIASVFGSFLAVVLNSILSFSFVGVSSFGARFQSIFFSFAIMLSICLLASLFSHYSIYKKGIIPLLKGDSIENNNSRIKTIILIVSAAVYVILSLIILFILRENTSIISKVLSICISISDSILVIYFILLLLLMTLRLLHFRKKVFYSFLIRTFKKRRSVIIITSLIIMLISTISIVSNTFSTVLSNYYSSVDAYMVTANEVVADACLIDGAAKHNIGLYYKNYNATQKYNKNTIYINGCNTDDYLEYSQDYFISDSSSSMLNKLDTIDYSIIISTTLANKYNLSVGDEMTLLTIDGDKDFKIIGLVNSFENGGNNVLVSDKTFKSSFYYQSVIYFIALDDGGSLSDLVDFYNEYKTQFKFSIYDISASVKGNNASINNIFILLYFLISIISIVAVINIIMSIILDIKNSIRKHITEYSIGKSKTHIFLDKLYEYMFVIILTSIIASVLSGWVNYYIFDIINLTIGYFNYSYSVSFIAIIVGILIYVVCMSFSYNKIKKIDVINGIKGRNYE